MSAVKKLWVRLKAIPLRVYALAGAGAIVLLLLFIGSLYTWDYTNSSVFCGTFCHTMPPHYDSYLRSPHARVKCVECHIGRTFVGTAFGRKAGDLRYVVGYLANDYSFPIRAKEVQPARESCEKCHWPEKFSNDTVRTIRRFEPDENNTLVETSLVMKTGGGTEREGLGYGIHWHIENAIDFIYTDELKQEIPWVQVTDAQGNTTVYADLETPLTAEQIASLPRRRMDCLDCHNRVSHTFQSPEQVMDEGLALNRVDEAIPEIKQKGVEVLSVQYANLEQGKLAIQNLDAYYREHFADYYAQNQASVQNAIQYLLQVLPSLRYASQGVDWTTHPNNIGHKDWPGCFRCHDGKHLTVDQSKAIRLECNICHSIPQVKQGSRAAQLVLTGNTPEPDSHRTTTWLFEHRTRFDASCEQCHDTRNAGGKDNSSFCSNSACHGTKWTFAGFDAPGIAKLNQPPVKTGDSGAPPSIPHPIGGEPDCQICHNTQSKVRPMPQDHAGRANTLCTACHNPTIPPEQAQTASLPPQVPHDLAGRDECLGCHDSQMSGIPQVPQFHKDYGFKNAACLTCHEVENAVLVVTAQPTATASAANSPTSAAPLIATSTRSPTAQPTATSEPSKTALAATTAPTSDGTATAQVTDAAPVQATITPTAGASNTAVGQPTVEQAGAGGPKAQPANHAGRKVCLACHTTGVGGATQPPADHAGRTDELCAVCHKPPP